MNYITLKELYEALKPLSMKSPNLYIIDSSLLITADGDFYELHCITRKGQNTNIKIPIKSANNNHKRSKQND